ncbi:protein phosphatase 2C domain-containing protein [Streptomyces sp. NPDC005301]|uniref:protein phosphatase 2C domain-containing protein n=1 Tax=Streptomyces sp. NPDC005301 TaxID=3156874 RepID=UPI0033B408A7
MSQQGESPTGHEDDWWGQLYDDSTGDTGPAAAADSLDDRFASASGTVGRGDPAPGAYADEVPPRPGETHAVPEQRTGGSGTPSATSGPRDPGPGPRDRGPGPKVGAPEDRTPAATDGTPPADGTGGGRPPGGTAGVRPSAGAAWSASPDAAGNPPPTGPRPAAEDEPAPASPAVPPVGPPPKTPPLPVGPPPPTASPRPPAGSPPVGVPPPPAGYLPVEEPGGTAPAPPDEPTLAPLGRSAGSAWPSLAESGSPAAGPGLPDPVGHVGSGPPTYDAEPTALPPADPDALADLVADTVLEGAQYGACTLRAVSVRGDSARYRGEPRRDALLTARFGTGEDALVLVAMATGARATPGAHRAAAEACRWIGRAVGRSQARLAEDIRAGRRGDLKSGLHRLTDRSLGRLRASAAEQGVEPEEYTASLRCLLLPADPECRTRVFFGVGPGGLFRLRDGEWQDIEPRVAETAGEPVVGFGSPPHETPEGDRLTMDLGITTPPSPYEPAPRPPRAPFRFRASVARPGDTLLLCTDGLAEPLRGEPELAAHLTTRWSTPEPPGLATFLVDSQVRVKGYADDRTAAAVWEA